MGDNTFEQTPRKIIHINYFGGKNAPLYRYYLEGLTNVSYEQQELMKA